LRIVQSDPTTNHIRQNLTSSLPCVLSVDASRDNKIRIGRKRPGFCFEQGSRKRLLVLGILRPERGGPSSNLQRHRAVPVSQQYNDGRQTGPPCHPLNTIQWIWKAVVCSKRRRAGDLLSVCLKHVKPVGTSLVFRALTEIFVGQETDIVECSRKKSRCPGEKPACSLCARLKQSCVYADDGSMPEVRSAAIERRMVSLAVVVVGPLGK
jgi:hypothetical protein